MIEIIDKVSIVIGLCADCPAAGAVAVVTDDVTMTSLATVNCCLVLPCRHTVLLALLLLVTSSRTGQLGSNAQIPD